MISCISLDSKECRDIYLPASFSKTYHAALFRSSIYPILSLLSLIRSQPLNLQIILPKQTPGERPPKIMLLLSGGGIGSG
jgi:hypothetical protein